MLRVTTLLFGLTLALLLVAGCTIHPVMPETATPAAAEEARAEATAAPTEEPMEEVTATTTIPAVEQSPFTTDILENMAYTLEVVGPDSFQLKDGSYEDAANHIVVNWVDTYALGDLNGEPSAAVVLIANTGGSGIFSNLIVVQEKDGTPVQVASTLLGDRITMNWVAIANDQIHFDLVTQGPDEAMCCATQRTSVIYVLDGDQLTNTDATAIGVQAQITGTAVITYVPTTIPTTTQQGSCFANAIGLGRADAWRCTVDNAIYDPCFEVDSTPTIVCGADPITGEEGFVLELTEPLPTPDPGAALGPWIVQLASGTICGLSTGTIPGVGDQSAPYACADEAHSNLMQNFTVYDPYWYAQNVVFELGDNGFWIQASVLTPVVKIWH